MWGDVLWWEVVAVFVGAVFSDVYSVLAYGNFGEVFEEPTGGEVCGVLDGGSVVFVGEVAGLV